MLWIDLLFEEIGQVVMLLWQVGVGDKRLFTLADAPQDNPCHVARWKTDGNKLLGTEKKGGKKIQVKPVEGSDYPIWIGYFFPVAIWTWGDIYVSK